MMYKKLYALAFTFMIALNSYADEGMWLPVYIKQLLLYKDMQELGLELTPDQIYSINHASIKDAVVSLGGFCTGEIISDQGLLLTNHHCGYDAIQSHSTVENDLLKNGFFAATQKDELPNEGLFARFLVRMEDITPQFQQVLNDSMTADQRQMVIAQMSQQIQKQAEEATGYEASVKSFFAGNEFYLLLYETYQDVRLVGAPPEAIGKFGGDADNWEWPRHTGDFSLFRIYTGPDGKPADYSPDNVPLNPKYHFSISLNGIQEGDFAMVMGFPGSTNRYLTSYGVQLALDISNPTRVAIRDKRLSLLKEDMDANEDIRLKYASKYAQVSNYWKYFIGQSQGLKNLNVIEKKRGIERKFKDWIAEAPQKRARYDMVLQSIQKAYDRIREYQTAYIYMTEAVFGTEILPFAYQFAQLENLLDADTIDTQKMMQVKAGLQEAARSFFKDYHAPTDQKVFAALLKMYYKNVPPDQLPEVLTKARKKYKGDFNKWAADIFSKSIFDDSAKVRAYLADPDLKSLKKDPAYQAVTSFMENYFQKIAPALRSAYGVLENNNRLFVAGLRKMNPDKMYYPDANSTLRFTYGTVKSYEPKDAVLYEYETTLEGVAEKRDPNDPEFQVPGKLMELYRKKDFGRYGENGRMPVCFITTNDITGGNSGSPVINGKGQLIGTAFDGNWEAMSGDIAFEDSLQRCINVDIRYTLFLIDKFAGAKHIVDEMTIVQEIPKKEQEAVPVEELQNDK